MGSVALLQSLKDSIVGQAGVKTIFGEPISAQGKTIIPIAKLIYGYGGGAGTGWGWKFECARRRWWRRRRSLCYSCGRDPGERPADPLYTDHQPEKDGRRRIWGTLLGIVLGWRKRR